MTQSYVGLLPHHKPPKGIKYFLGTWSGRILFINSIIFIYTCFLSHSLFLPDLQFLIELGAKDPVAIAQGEYWRFFTPIFLHVGLLHFALNSLALYYIGYQLEKILSAWWYLAIYFISGVMGFLASSAFTLSISAGASGSLFGLLGSGFYLERSIGQKIQEMTGHQPKQKVYSSTIILNIIIGFLIPGIDNAAHLGGLVVGILLTAALIHLKPNRVKKENKSLSYGIFVFIGAMFLSLGFYAANPTYTFKRFEKSGDEALKLPEAIHYYNEALKLQPQNSRLRFKRGQSLLYFDMTDLALEDLEVAANNPQQRLQIENLIKSLESTGRAFQARMLESILEEKSQML